MMIFLTLAVIVLAVASVIHSVLLARMSRAATQQRVKVTFDMIKIAEDILALAKQDVELAKQDGRILDLMKLSVPPKPFAPTAPTVTH